MEDVDHHLPRISSLNFSLPDHLHNHQHQHHHNRKLNDDIKRELPVKLRLHHSPRQLPGEEAGVESAGKAKLRMINAAAAKPWRPEFLALGADNDVIISRFKFDEACRGSSSASSSAGSYDQILRKLLERARARNLLLRNKYESEGGGDDTEGRRAPQPSPVPPDDRTTKKQAPANGGKFLFKVSPLLPRRKQLDAAAVDENASPSTEKIGAGEKSDVESCRRRNDDRDPIVIRSLELRPPLPPMTSSLPAPLRANQKPPSSSRSKAVTSSAKSEATARTADLPQARTTSLSRFIVLNAK